MVSAELDLSTLVTQLRKDLEDAERLRHTGSSTTILEMYNFWAGISQKLSQEKLLEPQASQETDFFSDTELIAVGVLGLGRVLTDSYLFGYKLHIHDRDKVAWIIEYTHSIAKFLKISQRAPWTMHGAIHWLAEYVADEGRALEVFGEVELAQLKYDEGIEAAEVTHQETAESLTLPYLSAQTLPPEDKELYIQQRQAVGAISALAVLYSRRGQSTKNLEDMVLSLRMARQAYHYEKNPERLQTLGARTIAAATSRAYQGSVTQRLEGTLLGIQSGGLRSARRKAVEKVEKFAARQWISLRKAETRFFYSVLRKIVGGPLAIDKDYIAREDVSQRPGANAKFIAYEIIKCSTKEDFLRLMITSLTELYVTHEGYERRYFELAARAALEAKKLGATDEEIDEARKTGNMLGAMERQRRQNDLGL